ncbi:Subunit of heteropentameric Replication factor C (RF-C) [Entomophthora muscae]|uniref:Subunit of heteropentameric Replication factor C (RF-C) n=1 Tax=Entomophthora muscae TaxID=34485 RepID=A0ACC2SXM5_9FUNG|nr:Subunit of heteropentameric Replication factor C (RF-C) [Entomophthora muscae]
MSDRMDDGSDSSYEGPYGQSTAENLPWVEKYRPNTLNDLVSQKDIVDTISRFMESGKLPHLLFYGPPGTGKTSTILACARQLYDKNISSMVLELNASDDRGISVVREQIKDFASTQLIQKGGFKLVILDEADAMTNAAQSALRRVIEKYTTNVRFCIICNYVSKIIPAVQSRCTKFRFAPLEEDLVTDRLNQVVDTEKVNITESGKSALLRISKGDMRRVLNILQACYSAFDVISEREVYLCTGMPLPEDIEQIRDWLLNSDFTAARDSIMALKTEKGLALQDILSQLYELILELNVPSHVLAYILDKLAEIECNLSIGSTESLQLSSMIGSFKLAVEMIAK